jgi:hypothetical protein
MADLVSAARMISDFENNSLTTHVAELEELFQGANRSIARTLCSSNSIAPALLSAALTLKKTAGQINVIVHCVGVLVLLQYILEEDETIESLSLGAGSTGKAFDLETNFSIAEFKFIQWRGGSEAIRQNSLFKDFYNLAEYETNKSRYLYVVGEEHPLKFLTGGRAIDSILSRNNKLWKDFQERYDKRFTRVSEYYKYKKQCVKIVDIKKIAPDLEGLFSQIDITD